MEPPNLPTIEPQALSLVIVEMAEIAEDIYRFELRHASGDALPEFGPGAHVAVGLPGGRRQKYSLCNPASERDRYVIAVKREDYADGGLSRVIDTIEVGTPVACVPPRNDLLLDRRAANFLFVAGGLGIVPILSMARYLRAIGNERFKVYYCTRSPERTAFRAELTGPEWRDHVAIHHDFGDPDRSLDLWPILERATDMHLYCCGPRSMLEAVRDMSGHWSSSRVHFESLGGGDALRSPADAAFRVRLARTGAVVEVPADRSILESLRDAGYAIPSSCESGTCGTCRTRLLEGTADHRDLVLSDDERGSYIMVCVSRAHSADLVLDR